MTYNKNFLFKVVARIDFSTPIFPNNDDRLKNIYAQLIERLPIFNKTIIPQHELNIVTSIDGSQPPTQEFKIVEKEIWDFYDRNRTVKLHIEETYFVLEYDRYNGFPELKDLFLHVNKVLFEEFKDDLKVSRMGLRYINQVELFEKNPIDWKKYLDKNMLTTFEMAEEKDLISRAFNNLEVNYGDYNVKFQYGMHNPDFPAVIKKKLFILDCDVYLIGYINQNEIEGKLSVFHDKAKFYFEKSITDKMRSYMNGN